ncbi:Tubby-related protein 2 [Heterocephalus glaber]|uniref:Tubby-related protein 2 n=1 Tax=Heterocephalus glaber TaxID=10181 RepID=G5BF12_HETGA|nr:Tubby-related protein 2 [Heterocephalus glaber]
MLRPPQEGRRVQCCIRRDQRGVEKGLFPVYYLYLEAANSWKHFLLAGKEKVEQNLQLSHLLGPNGPIPGWEQLCGQSQVQYLGHQEDESILSRFQRGVRQGVVLLQNKPPVWSDESDAFVLNFHGRVTRASVKNFQIINPNKLDNEAVPRALEGEVSRDVWSVASLLPLAPGPQPGEDLKEYMLRPPQEGQRVQCCIGRDQRGMEKGLFPVYYLYLEAANSWKRFLLAGRKRKWSKTSNYLISLDPRDLSRDGDNFVGKVRSNILGTRFVIFDDGLNPEEKNSHLDKTWIRQELGAVCYEDESILSRFQRGVRQGLVLLQNKPLVWSDESDAFMLNFHRRVTRASVKNLQIINPNTPDKVVLQFGPVATDTFTMDFCFPLCPLQAFAICLSSFDGKLACV